MEHYLKVQGHDMIRESLDALYESEDIGRLDPEVEYLQERSIEKDDW
jgi:hypothetical protein